MRIAESEKKKRRLLRRKKKGVFAMKRGGNVMRLKRKLNAWS
jgi:hypothetical protein